MIAATYKIIGINEFATRFWSALFGLGCVILLYFFAKKLLHSEKRGLFWALTLLGFTLFYKQSRMGMMDTPLCFFILLGTFFFLLGRKKQSYLFWVGPVIGIAFMIKSFAAFQLPIILILFSLASGESRLIINPRFLLGLSVGILICVPWHLHQYMNYGTSFIDEYFLLNITKRSFEVLPGHPSRGWLYYSDVILSEFPLGKIQVFIIPYFLFLAFREKTIEKRSVYRLAASAILVILVLFTVIKTKFRWYIVPVYPFLAIATVESIDQIFSMAKKYRRILVNIALIILIIIPAARIAFYKEYRVLDYRPELKKICIDLKAQNRNRDLVFFYEIKDEPTALFYSGQKMTRVSKDHLLSSVHSSQQFICLMSKKDGLFEKFKTRQNSLYIIKETDNFLLFRKTGI
jgi:4-amino-4-deoxy-L-arabinose transferase-like glycosyltransferase